MYLGKIVELAPALRSCTGDPRTRIRKRCSRVRTNSRSVDRAGDELRIVLEGDPPTPTDPPSGCRFRSRALLAGRGDLRRGRASIDDIAEGHRVACHFNLWS